jgi:hypothetical protein
MHVNRQDIKYCIHVALGYTTRRVQLDRFQQKKNGPAVTAHNSLDRKQENKRTNILKERPCSFSSITWSKLCLKQKNT